MYVSIGPAKVPEPGCGPWVVSYLVDNEGGIEHLGYAVGPAVGYEDVEALMQMAAPYALHDAGLREAIDRIKRDHPSIAQSQSPELGAAYFPIRVEVNGIEPATVLLPAGVTVGDVSVASGAVRLNVEREAFGTAIPDDPRDLAHATLRLLSDVLAMRSSDAFDVRIGIDGEWSLREPAVSSSSSL